MDYIKDIFGADGLLSHAFKAYQLRDSQIVAARAIDHAFRNEENAAVEAPTGCGKSLSYIVPMVKQIDEARTAGKPIKCVVSTANIALQDQLINKDLPMLRGILPWQFSFGLLKGKQNYLCKRALEAVEDQLLRQTEHSTLDDVAEWAKKTSTGDKNELTFQVDSIWHRFSVSGDECIGQKCTFHSECWAEAAKKRVFESDIIVTNHMMLSLHLHLLQDVGEALILPKFNYLVIDEAHELPAYARKVWGNKISARVVSRAIAPWKKLGNVDLDPVEDASDKAFQDTRVLLDSMKGKPPRVSTDRLATILTPLLKALLRTAEELKAIEETDECNEKEYEYYDEGRSRVQTLVKKIESILSPSQDEICWLEPDNRQPTASINTTVVEIGPHLKDALFEAIPSAITISATLATGGGRQSMQYMEGELGLTRHRNYILPSPFDLPSQLKIIAPEISEPADIKFESELACMVEEAIIQARGRTLALFTSFKSMESVYESIVSKRKIQYKILKQGDASVPRLVEQFKNDIDSVLFGVASLWTGIDVPGDALSCLIVDKFPFTTPVDPLLSALQEKYGRDCFYRIQIPSAVMKFRQGAGRLIRTDTDRGVLVIMDRRLTSKPYGSQFIASFNGVHVSKDIQEIGRFLKAEYPSVA